MNRDEPEHVIRAVSRPKCNTEVNGPKLTACEHPQGWAAPSPPPAGDQAPGASRPPGGAPARTRHRRLESRTGCHRTRSPTHAPTSLVALRSPSIRDRPDAQAFDEMRDHLSGTTAHSWSDGSHFHRRLGTAAARERARRGAHARARGPGRDGRHWLHDELPSAHGLFWMSRPDNEYACLMLFGDRLASLPPIRPVSMQPIAE